MELNWVHAVNKRAANAPTDLEVPTVALRCDAIPAELLKSGSVAKK